jgi:hypothetical protein
MPKGFMCGMSQPHLLVSLVSSQYLLLLFLFAKSLSMVPISPFPSFAPLVSPSISFLLKSPHHDSSIPYSKQFRCSPTVRLGKNVESSEAFPEARKAPPSPKKGFSLRPYIKKKEYVSSSGGLAMYPIQTNLVGRKSFLIKSKQKVVLDIQKGKQTTISRILGAGKALKIPLHDCPLF